MLGIRSHRLFLRAKTRDVQFHCVALFKELGWFHAEADTWGRACADHIARVQGEQLGQVFDYFRNCENHG